MMAIDSNRYRWIPNAVAMSLYGKKDLGDSLRNADQRVAKLAKAGVITGKPNNYAQVRWSPPLR
jgi:hypothetical protein